MTEQDLINAAIRSSTGAWFESHGRIFGKDRKAGLIKPRQNYLQRKIQAVIDKMEDEGLPVRIQVLKPRQRGSTTYGSAVDYTMLRRAPTSAVVIGGQVSQVQECWAMLQTYAKADAFDWKNTGEINSKAGTFSNGSKIIQETAGDAVAGIGGTHQCLHCFEVARWSEHGVSNGAEVLTNIMKCVPLLPGTLINLESTAEGSSGAFYDYWLSAIDAEDFLEGRVEVKPGQFVRCFAAWFQFDDSAMRLTDADKRIVESTLDAEAWYAGERELIELYGVTGADGVLRLGESVEDYDVWEQLHWRRWAIEIECKKDISKFERDYPHSWRTAFQKSGKQRFNQAGMAMIRKRLTACVPKHGIIEETKNRRFAFRQTELGETKVTIFEKPMNGRRYLVAVDGMTGETQVGGVDPDRHGVFVLRAGFWDAKGAWQKMATAARIVQNRWDIDVLEESVWQLARYYGNQSGAKIVIEMNQDKGLTELLKLRGADLYQREIFNQREQRTTKALGYQTNVKTRETLVEALAAVIREWDKPGEGIDIWCPLALEQCENFVRKANGRSEHADGWHDDDVLAMALGVELIDHASTYIAQTNPWMIPPDLREQRPAGAGSAYS